MGILDKFKPKNQNIEIVEIAEDKVEEIQKKLYDIQFILTKIELINKSHGGITFIEKELKEYKEQFEAIKNKYSDDAAYEYPNRVYFLVALSSLEDELKPFSQACYYLEDLHDFKNVKITKENIKSQKQILLEHIKEISEYHYPNKELDDKIHESLNELIFDMINKEITYDDIGLYDTLPNFSKLEVQKRLLNLLLVKAHDDENIKDFLLKKDIADIKFSYDLLRILSGKPLESIKIDSIDKTEAKKEGLKQELSLINDNDFNKTNILKTLRNYLVELMKKNPSDFDGVTIKYKVLPGIIRQVKNYTGPWSGNSIEPDYELIDIYRCDVIIYLNGEKIYKVISTVRHYPESKINKPGYKTEVKLERYYVDRFLEEQPYESFIYVYSCILGFDVNEIVTELKQDKEISRPKTI